MKAQFKNFPLMEGKGILGQPSLIFGCKPRASGGKRTWKNNSKILLNKFGRTSSKKGAY